MTIFLGHTKVKKTTTTWQWVIHKKRSKKETNNPQDNLNLGLLPKLQ